MPDCVFRNLKRGHETKEVIALEKLCYGKGSWQYSEDSTHVLSAFVADTDNVVVAECQGSIVGFYVVYGLYAGLEKNCQLLRLCVHPEMQRRGIGRAMIRNACARAVNSEIDSFRCIVGEDDLRAQLFLKAAGWYCDKVFPAGDRFRDAYRFKWAPIATKAVIDVTQARSPKFAMLPMGNPEIA